MIKGQHSIRGIRDRIKPNSLLGRVSGSANKRGVAVVLSKDAAKAILRYLDGDIANTSVIVGNTVSDALGSISTTLGSIASGSGVTIEIALIAAEGKINSAENLPFITLSKAITIPVNFAGAASYAETAPTADATFTIQQNGSNVGTIKFAAGSHTATFTAASPIALAVGDRLAPIGPSPADATLSDVSVTIQGTRV
jgi:hypothetical protein